MKSLPTRYCRRKSRRSFSVRDGSSRADPVGSLLFCVLTEYVRSASKPDMLAKWRRASRKRSEREPQMSLRAGSFASAADAKGTCLQSLASVTLYAAQCLRGLCRVCGCTLHSTLDMASMDTDDLPVVLPPSTTTSGLSLALYVTG